jgi:Uma2 family endonuclease
MSIAELNADPQTLADLLHQIGDVPPERIRARPFPGSATEEDVVSAWGGPERRLCELVDGILVEKALGTREALIATLIAHQIWEYLEKHDLGLAIGADGMYRIRIGLVRIPDVSFVSWDRLPGEELPDEAVAGVIPELAVEVLSKSNTQAEIGRKLREYFDAGVRLVWIIDPETESARVHTSPMRSQRLGKNQSLSGRSVLPGFALPLRDLFSRSKRRGRRPK